MSSYANMDCRFKNLHGLGCKKCKKKLNEIFGSINDVRKYRISIDAEKRTVRVAGEVDRNKVMKALGKSCDHAELVNVDLQGGRDLEYNYSTGNTSRVNYRYDEDYYNNLRSREVTGMITAAPHDHNNLYSNHNGYNPPAQYITSAPHQVYNPNDNYDSSNSCSNM